MKIVKKKNIHTHTGVTHGEQSGQVACSVSLCSGEVRASRCDVPPSTFTHSPTFKPTHFPHTASRQRQPQGTHAYTINIYSYREHRMFLVKKLHECIGGTCKYDFALELREIVLLTSTIRYFASDLKE